MEVLFFDEKGKGVLNPEELKIWIVLALLVFSIVGGVWNYFKVLAPAPESAMRSLSMEAAPMSMNAVEQVPEVSYWPLVFKAAIVLFTVTLVYLLFKNAQYKKQLGFSLTKK